jgi:hypothetical protein
MGEVDDCNVIVDISGLTGGTYNCQLTVDAGTAANSPQIVDVNLIVIGPEIELSSTHFDFTAVAGGANPADQILSISNSGGGTLKWVISEDCDWLSAEPNSGSSAGEANDVNLSVDITGLGRGIYDCNLTILDANASNSPQIVGVTLSIGAEGIWVSPGSFDVNVIQGTTLPEVLTIGNDGTDDVNFIIRTRIVGGSGKSAERNSRGTGGVKEEIFSVPKGHDFTVVGDAAYEPGRLIVRFAPTAKGEMPSTADKNQILGYLGGGAVERDFTIVPGLSVVQLPAGMTVEEALAVFNNTEDILYAEPDYKVEISSTFPDDPRFGELWGMHNTGQSGGTVDADIDAPEAWDISTGSSEIIVAVIDTGVDYTHPDLAANMWVNTGEIPGNGLDDDGNGYIDDVYGYDFCNYDGNPMDDHYHGTHCAGTIGAVGDNGEGVAGVCWDVRIMALKFLDSGGSGWTSDAINCVEYSILMGANLSSNSWGGGGYSQGLKDAINAAGAAGMLFVAAAGNDSSNNDTYPFYPSSYDCNSLIAVMATDRNDNKSGFSNYGLVSVDLGAPGSSILSCEPGSSYQYLSGTSMATPHVAGASALLWSMNQMLSNSEVKDILLQTVDKTLAGLCVSEGRLNVYSAILETRAPWIEIEPEEGTVGAGDFNDISVTFSSIEYGMEMAPGTYEAEIVVLSNDPCNPIIIIPVTMTVPEDDLSVTPQEVFDSNGIEGGPFEPECKTYTLTNNGALAISWTTSGTESWLMVEPNSGVLDANSSIDVNVCITPDANLLDPNIYTELLVFKNTDSGSNKPRPVTLTVKPPDCFTQSVVTNLDFLSLMFSPDGSNAYYEACRERVDEFPTDPNGGTYVPLGNDDFAEVILNNDANLLFYGTRYDCFYIGSNGYITFGQGDANSSASLENHFGLPRISALFSDLDPTVGGTISYKQLEDRVVVTFEDMPLSGNPMAINSFQVEMFFVDGSICVSWLKLAADSGVAGLSKGRGLPPVYFKESNLSGYLRCCPLGDFDRDYYVNFRDFAVLAMHWLDEDCGIPSWCEKTDLDFSGATDNVDLDIFTDNWLAENEWWLEPISHWKLDEGSGTIAYDSAGSNDGTLVNGPLWTPGQINGALSFDGVNDYVRTANNIFTNAQLSSGATLSAWFKTGSTAYGFIADDEGYLLLGINYSTHPNKLLGTADGGEHIYYSSSDVNDNLWHHAAIVWDGTNTAIVYLDGVEESSEVSGPPTPDRKDRPFTIGMHASISAYFDGIIDDVRVYDRALTAEEVMQLYQAGL